jgi:nicotinate phosphoribosyltransferase
VGTQLSTSYDAPTLGGVYKLVEEEVDGRVVYKIKLSTEKATYPGRKQVWRRMDAEGRFLSDVITLADEPPPSDAIPLLEEVMREGRLVAPLPTLEEIRERALENVRRLPEMYRRLKGAASYPVMRSERLERLREQVIAELQRA